MNEFWRKPIAGFPTPFDPWVAPGDSVFDEDVAERVCDYWQRIFTLKDGKFEGRKFALLDWQKQIIGHLFGWKRPDGSRRFRRLFLYIPKKNGKTEMGAGIGLLLMHADGEAGAEVFSLASDTTQARIVFDAAAKMVSHSAVLSRSIDVFTGYRSMKHGKTSSYWKVLSSKKDSKHGPNVHGLLIDELHTQHDNELVETMEAGTISRRQPLIIKMSTSDFAGDSPCNQELEYAKGVLDGSIPDPYYMPVIYDATTLYQDDPDCWKRPDVWEVVNPSMGVTVQREYFEQQVNMCRAQPSLIANFKRLHLNIQTSTATTWLDHVAWTACGSHGIEPRGPVYLGLDLASVTDMNAIAMYWPETHSLRVRIYSPMETIQHRAEQLLWHQDGHLIAFNGVRSDYGKLRADVNEIGKEWQIAGLAYDPWNASHLITELANDDGIPCIEFRQGYKTMSYPAKQFEAAVIAGELRHEDCPVLNWQAANACIITDPAGNIKPVKEARGSTKKVDGIIAAIMAYAIGEAAVVEQPHNLFVAI